MHDPNCRSLHHNSYLYEILDVGLRDLAIRRSAKLEAVIASIKSDQFEIMW